MRTKENHVGTVLNAQGPTVNFGMAAGQYTTELNLQEYPPDTGFLHKSD